MSLLNKLKSLIPLEMLEAEAQKQIFAALQLDFLKKLAIMPDCHAGYHLPIGGVALLDGVISPAYVGYDIGCGMCSIETEIDIINLSQKEKEKIFNEILRLIPTGFSIRGKGLDYDDFESASGDKELDKQVNEKIRIQLGTLGGGNHFIELGENRKGKLVITIHSGSRKAGHTVGGYYMKLSNSKEKDLPNGFFRFDKDNGQSYLQDLLFMQEYALDNRKQMLLEILDIFTLPHSLLHKMINENHNHAIVTEDGILHRKGATPSDLGQYGVIPGNMRDGIYIVKGLGNKDFLSSSSHGAGRKMSRTKAKESIDFNKFQEQMDGIIAIVNKNVLDEAPDAYKKLDDVIKYQDGIVVDVVDHVKPHINIKADEKDNRQKRKDKRKKQKQARDNARKNKII